MALYILVGFVLCALGEQIHKKVSPSFMNWMSSMWRLCPLWPETSAISITNFKVNDFRLD